MTQDNLLLYLFLLLLCILEYNPPGCTANCLGQKLVSTTQPLGLQELVNTHSPQQPSPWGCQSHQKGKVLIITLVNNTANDRLQYAVSEKPRNKNKTYNNCSSDLRKHFVILILCSLTFAAINLQTFPHKLIILVKSYCTSIRDLCTRCDTYKKKYIQLYMPRQEKF